MPAALGGVNFLSGGFSEEEASNYLSAMNKLDAKLRPWSLSFSYGRALQQSALKAWKGSAENVEAAKQVFAKVAEANSKAQLGQYEGGSLSGQSLFVANYTY